MCDVKMKYAKKIGFALASVASAFVLSLILTTIQTTDVRESVYSPGLVLPESTMGKKVGIDEARQISKAEVKVPTKLPESTSLIQSYVSDDGERVTILYSNPKLETIKNFGATELPESQIIVTMQKMTNNPIQNIGESLPVIITVQEEGKPEKAVEVKPTTPTFDYTTINGVDGVIIQKRSEQNRPFSEISWWSNNTLYQIYADLPSSELQKIAESMQ
jgi:hypothetical protein